MTSAEVAEPFPIFLVAGNHLLFDVDVISHVRRRHNICGVLVGTLPQVPQQNVFLGIPVLLMPEEARVLVEGGHAYVVDDVAAHKAAFLEGGLEQQEREALKRTMRMQGLEAARAVQVRASERREKALGSIDPEKRRKRQVSEETTATGASTEADTSIFSTDGETEDTASTLSGTSTPHQLVPFGITPTTSYPPLRASRNASATSALPEVPASYPLFAHLHRLGYFMTPGLRFGCQYTVYPGDPLRFHSHFLAVGKPWDEEFRLMEIVGGGRLGTGVKKGFMIGGAAPGHRAGYGDDDEQASTTRAFCFEWAGM